MKDRTPTHPGRVQLVPVTGQTNIYDMTMADDPTEAGTALNKANLLSDAAAAAVWPDVSDRPSDPVPSEAFSTLSEKCKLLLDFTSDANIGTDGGRGSAKTVSLSDNIEKYRLIEIWGYHSGVSEPSLYIDVGTAVNADNRIVDSFTVGGVETMYCRVLFASNDDTTGHMLFNIKTTGATSDPVVSGTVLTGTNRLTGNQLTLSTGTNTSSAIRAGLRLIIIGTKF